MKRPSAARILCQYRRARKRTRLISDATIAVPEHLIHPLTYIQSPKEDIKNKIARKKKSNVIKCVSIAYIRPNPTTKRLDLVDLKFVDNFDRSDMASMREIVFEQPLWGIQLATGRLIN